jgi:flavin-dependent dehydrogenase
MTDSFDLIVVGGGPAGTSAAITAARDGWKVLLLERDRFPRHKVCGEFVSAESLELLGWLLGETSEKLLRHSLPLSESRLLLDGHSIRVPISPAAASIARYDLDLALWNAANHFGVTAVQKAAVRKVGGRGPFRVETNAGEYSGRALINASGRWSNLNPAYEGDKSARWMGLKTHCRGEMEPGVDLYFFRSGYCGVQPVRGPDGAMLLNVCALLQPKAANSLDELLQCHPALASRSRQWSSIFPSPLSTFPLVFREPRSLSGTVLNAGDAASFVDPFVGDGISLALKGGNLAAQSLSRYFRGECGLAEAGRDYERFYGRCLRPVYSVSSVLRKLLGIPRPMRAPFLAACEHSPRLAQYLVKATRSRAAPLHPAMAG